MTPIDSGAPPKSPEVLKLERELRITKAALRQLTTQYEGKDYLRRAAAAQNAMQEEYISMLLDSSPYMIVLVDKQERFRLCTKSFLDAVGVPNFEFIRNKPFRDVVGPRLMPEDMAALDEYLQIALKEGSSSFNRYLDFGHTGHPRYYSMTGRRIDDTQHSEGGFLGIFVDNTDFEEQKKAAEDANRSKSDFLAAMSHEIRTPMNAITGLNDILARTPLNDSQRKYLADIRSAAATLLSIINDILDFSKIEAGKMTIVSAPFRLRGMLEHLYAMYAQTFADKSLYLHIDVADNLPDWAMGDELRVRQVLTNLISNASKYTIRGGAELHAALDEARGELVFTVRDTGIGVKEENIGRLFLAFERLDKLKNRNIQGTGLGLPISHRFCELMGGSLSVESHYGEGSCFTARLPYVPAEQAEETEAPEELVFSAPQLRALVVDDIPINLIVAEAMLGVFDIIPDTAKGGVEAIEKALENDYDVIFMDHMMPGIDGMEATRRLREMGGRFADIPIVALTANVVNDAEKTFLASGFTGFLAKPLELKPLAACLHGLVKSLRVCNERG
ncbi:MAG: response regulator [Oscillospiraceae bacterium]|nr:response regulator [Oscillospiraceae bacterium]